ncbi:hypothetical protein KXV42_009066, partial [Aspergillus fumigatus]
PNGGAARPPVSIGGRVNGAELRMGLFKPGAMAHEVGNIASVLVAGGAGEGAVERYLRHLHCGEQSPGGGRLDARTAAGAATQRCGAAGEPVLGRPRAMKQRQVLARQKTLLFRMTARGCPQVRQIGFKLGDARCQIGRR